jgi:hypothetical protein
MDQIYTDPIDTPADREKQTSQSPYSPLAGRNPFTSSHGRPVSTAMESRISELESENQRLQRLVAELLIKNQQLRRSPTTD